MPEPWINEDEVGAMLAIEHPELMAEIRRVLPGLRPDQQLIVAALVVETCPGCYANGRGCYCRRDD